MIPMGTIESEEELKKKITSILNELGPEFIKIVSLLGKEISRSN